MQFLFSLLFFTIVSFQAYGEDLGGYVPPPMFEVDSEPSNDEPYPPLPPRRPDKLSVPSSYIRELLKKEELEMQLENNLEQPSGRDVLEQINPHD